MNSKFAFRKKRIHQNWNKLLNDRKKSKSMSQNFKSVSFKFTEKSKNLKKLKSAGTTKRIAHI